MLGYLRLFSLLSLILVTGLTVLASFAFRQHATQELTRIAEKNNVSLVESYVGNVWSNYRAPLVALSVGDAAQMKDNPQVLQYARATLNYFQDMPMLRANIYLRGVLLMSVEKREGSKLASQAPSVDTNFTTAHLRGTAPISNLVQQVPMQGASPATVVQTVVPLGAADDAPGSGVEIIYDVSTAADKVAAFQIYGGGIIIAFFFVFLGLQFAASRKAEAIIARQHDANLELSAAAARAEAQSKEKSQFLANVSHELRTPLNAIIGFSNIIKTEAGATLQGKHGDYINDIHASGVHLLSLINDILDYSKAEAGKLEMEVGEVNATKVVQNCIRLVGPRAEFAQVQVMENLPKTGITMITDGKKLKQILLNLLSNAVKFTPPEGEVRISAWHNISDDTYSFEVSDTGIGIAAKDISIAMSPFGQVDNALSRKYEGTGLGLPLTKKFVELMGGTFTIKSKVNVGTTITFTLPRELKEREGLIIKQAT